MHIPCVIQHHVGEFLFGETALQILAVNDTQGQTGLVHLNKMQLVRFASSDTTHLSKLRTKRRTDLV